MTDSYQIVDEPKPSAFEGLVVDPIIILFASLLVPIFIELPFFGRLWLPLVWGAANGFLLGSPTKYKELLVAISAALLITALVFTLFYLNSNNQAFAEQLTPYIRILIQAVLFMALYLIVFLQSMPYEIFKYVRSSNSTH